MQPKIINIASLLLALIATGESITLPGGKKAAPAVENSDALRAATKQAEKEFPSIHSNYASRPVSEAEAGKEHSNAGDKLVGSGVENLKSTVLKLHDQKAQLRQQMEEISGELKKTLTSLDVRETKIQDAIQNGKAMFQDLDKNHAKSDTMLASKLLTKLDATTKKAAKLDQVTDHSFKQGQAKLTTGAAEATVGDFEQRDAAGQMSNAMQCEDTICPSHTIGNELAPKGPCGNADQCQAGCCKVPAIDCNLCDNGSCSQDKSRCTCKADWGGGYCSIFRALPAGWLTKASKIGKAYYFKQQDPENSAQFTKPSMTLQTGLDMTKVDKSAITCRDLPILNSDGETMSWQSRPVGKSREIGNCNSKMTNEATDCAVVGTNELAKHVACCSCGGGVA